jgi:hypothetical protein
MRSRDSLERRNHRKRGPSCEQHPRATLVQRPAPLRWRTAFGAGRPRGSSISCSQPPTSTRALDWRRLIEVIGERTRSRQPAHSSSDYDRLFTYGGGHLAISGRCYALRPSGTCWRAGRIPQHGTLQRTFDWIPARTTSRAR